MAGKCLPTTLAIAAAAFPLLQRSAFSSPPPPDTMLAVYREDLGLFSARVGRAVRSTKSEALERAWAHAVDHLAFPWPAIFNGQEFRLVWYEMVLDLDQLNPRELTKLH